MDAAGCDAGLAGGHVVEEAFDINESLSWIREALAQISRDEPEKVPQVLQRIVETVRSERPDLLPSKQFPQGPEQVLPK